MTASAVLLYFCFIADFLSFSRSVRVDVMVVEGWLSADAFQKAKNEFLRNNYRYLITTGFPDEGGFCMARNGKTIFNFRGKVDASPDNSYDVTLLIRGTRADGECSHFRIYADSMELGEEFAGSRMQPFHFHATLENTPGTIRIDFDNDHYTAFRDRNLYITSVSVNNAFILADNHEVKYYRQDGEYVPIEQPSQNKAILAANILVSAGLSDSLVNPAGSVIKIKSRTYTTALDVKKWMVRNDPREHCSITLVTQGYHARRSYVSFKKVFGNSADIGVICLPDEEISGRNWFMSPGGWKTILYETAGLLYLWVFVRS
jgi:hypothetical protein